MQERGFAVALKRPLARIAGEGAERSEAGEGILSSVLLASIGSICAAIKSERSPVMTLGNAPGAAVRLIVWCRGRGGQVERRGADTPVLDWRERICAIQAKAAAILTTEQPSSGTMRACPEAPLCARPGSDAATYE